jgi:hypothetical protein
VAWDDADVLEPVYDDQDDNLDATEDGMTASMLKGYSLALE